MSNRKRDTAELRRRAERRLASTPEQRVDKDDDAPRLVHELQVHQLELEMQNEELLSARHQVEAGLHRYTELFDFGPIGYFAVDATGDIREANFAGARLLGIERGRAVGKRFGSFVSERDVTPFERFLATVLASAGEDRKSETYELVLGRDPATARDVRITAAALEQPILSALLAVEDVTARRRAEDALRDESRRKDEFLAALSHELRNPLAPIRNSLILLARLPMVEDKARASLAVIERQVAHLTRLVDDLLDVTRIARGKVRLDRAPLELGELVRRTLDDHRATFEARGIQVETRVPPDPCWVYADGTRLVQVLGNLLGNAAKFTGRGGKVVVSIEREDSTVRLAVRDTGVGIAPEVRDRLFEPFSQAPQTLDRTRGGLGLGLATVKGLVELHGGSVGITSEGPGNGAEFTVRLPIVAAPAEPRRGVEPPRDEPHRVLVIEDNEDGALSLKEILELSGHEVHIAFDGPSGIALAREFKPEFVICDIGLPGMDGYQVARALRADDVVKDACLIALTGYATPGDVRRSREAGFNRHMAKPLTLEALRTMFTEYPTVAEHAH